MTLKKSALLAKLKILSGAFSLNSRPRIYKFSWAAMAPCGEVNPALQWVTHSSYLLGKQKETSRQEVTALVVTLISLFRLQVSVVL